MWQNFLTAFNAAKNKSNRRLVKKSVQIFLLSLFLASNGCDNKFTSFANKTDDTSLYYTALIDLRTASYTTAIAACTAMSAGFLSRRDVAVVCASAYAGRCGFTIPQTTTRIDTYISTPPAEKLFLYFMTLITGTTAQSLTDCSTAQSLLRGIGAAALRTSDENALMTLLSLHTISVVLNETADITDDGVVDGGFDACTSVNAAQAQEVGLAFWELNQSLIALSASPFYSTLATGVSGLCTLLTGIGEDLCASATPTSMSVSELKGARSLLKEGAAVGVDQCGGGASLATCNCP
jgi:hypothetical protein